LFLKNKNSVRSVRSVVDLKTTPSCGRRAVPMLFAQATAFALAAEIL
jgi:hypothetical protein